MKFVLKEDWTYETNFLGKNISKTIYTKGEIFEPNSDGLYDVTGPYGDINKLDIKQMRSYAFLEEVVELEPEPEFEIVIEEVPEDDDNLIKNWRIQLDVKTTRKKLKEFERVFKETVSNLL